MIQATLITQHTSSLLCGTTVSGKTHTSSQLCDPQHQVLHLRGRTILVSKEYHTPLRNWTEVSLVQAAMQ